MVMSYLGIFEWVYSQVMDHIGTPVLDFIATIINVQLGFVFEYILGPILIPIMQMLMDLYMVVGKFLFGFYYYAILKFFLETLDYVEKGFNIFMGLEPLTITYGGGKQFTGSLLECLIMMDSVRNAMWIIIFSGVGIATLLSIYGVARSSFDLDFENKRPVSHVMAQLFRALTMSALIPFMLWSMIQVSSVVLGALDKAVSYGTGTEDSKITLGSTVFTLCSVNAAWNNEDNMSTWGMASTEGGFGIRVRNEPNPGFKILDEPRREFYENNTANNYRNIGSVMVTFNFAWFDFVTGYILTPALLIIMILTLLTVIRRVFELMLLYLVSPYFVALMPVDDGEKFKQWLGMFAGKLVTGYGTVVLMKIYLILLPLFLRGGFLSDNLSYTGSYLMYFMFMLGGAWAVYKSGSLLTSLVNEAAGSMERESNREAMGALMMAASPIRRLGSGIAGKIGREAKGRAKSAFKMGTGALKASIVQSMNKRAYKKSQMKNTFKPAKVSSKLKRDTKKFQAKNPDMRVGGGYRKPKNAFKKGEIGFDGFRKLNKKELHLIAGAHRKGAHHKPPAVKNSFMGKRATAAKGASAAGRQPRFTPDQRKQYEAMRRNMVVGPRDKSPEKTFVADTRQWDRTIASRYKKDSPYVLSKDYREDGKNRYRMPDSPRELMPASDLARERERILSYHTPQERSSQVGQWLQQQSDHTGKELWFNDDARKRLEKTFDCDLSSRVNDHQWEAMVIRPSHDWYKDSREDTRRSRPDPGLSRLRESMDRERDGMDRETSKDSKGGTQKEAKEDRGDKK